eukprot:TRINITY_DN48505_c0_g1_i1.p1 TRINITY_DN48505_c0_g1~~TRINITY_DN48505_c0_g1_i1.p1  ORF type:complete len:331 (-),score=71.30 TRINITY_DN48505_c0_g1_i1:91-1083(-)
MPQVPQRPLRALCIVAAAAAVAYTVAVRRRQPVQSGEAMCHPNLARLRGEDGQEVLLIGTLPLDLDGSSRQLVTDALAAQRPDVVMVEGTPGAGVNAMLMSGRWDFLGMRKPNNTDWMDLGPDVAPVELPRPVQKKRGFLQLISGTSPQPPQRSLVPVKVGYWAYHLRGSVGGDVAIAVTTAAAKGVPLRFLGPSDGGFQGHVQVTLLAEQAARELLEEEHRKGQMSSSDMNAALKRAESHMRQDAGKWLRDARGETARLMQHLKEKMPEEVSSAVTAKLEERASRMAEIIKKTMEEDFRRGAVVLAVDQLVNVEGKLQQAGFSYVSQCA